MKNYNLLHPHKLLYHDSSLELLHQLFCKDYFLFEAIPSLDPACLKFEDAVH